MARQQRFVIDASMFPVNPNAAGVPPDDAPTDFSIAYKLVVRLTEQWKTGLQQSYFYYYEPSQLRIVNESSQTIWWLPVSEENAPDLIKYPLSFQFQELESGRYVDNPNIKQVKWIYLYAQAAATGYVKIQGLNYGKVGQDHIV